MLGAGRPWPSGPRSAVAVRGLSCPLCSLVSLSRHHVVGREGTRGGKGHQRPQTTTAPTRPASQGHGTRREPGRGGRPGEPGAKGPKAEEGRQRTHPPRRARREDGRSPQLGLAGERPAGRARGPAHRRPRSPTWRRRGRVVGQVAVRGGYGVPGPVRLRLHGGRRALWSMR